ncbi:hypothetical protein TWF281_000322 [Arthrobotrys megalospora]
MTPKRFLEPLIILKAEASLQATTPQTPTSQGLDVNSDKVMELLQELRDEISALKYETNARAAEIELRDKLAKIDPMEARMASIQARMASMRQELDDLGGFKKLHLRILINVAYRNAQNLDFPYTRREFLTCSDLLSDTTKDYFKQVLNSGEYDEISEASHITTKGSIARSVSLLEGEEAAAYRELFQYCFNRSVDDAFDSEDAAPDL